MNIALTLSQDGKAMLLYDQPLGFAPGWVEFSADKKGVRIFSDEGQEFVAGPLLAEVSAKLQNVSDILLVRMDQKKPVEGFEVSFINQTHF